MFRTSTNNDQETITLNYPLSSRKQGPEFTGKYTATFVLSQTGHHEDKRRIRSIVEPTKSTMCQVVISYTWSRTDVSIKVKLSLCLIKHHDMNVHGGLQFSST
jgi:hypothetical protein